MNEITLINNIKCCRLCLNDDNSNFEYISNDISTYKNKLYYILPSFVNLRMDDSTTFICNDCQFQIDLCYKFIQKCIKTNEIFEEYYLKYRNMSFSTFVQQKLGRITVKHEPPEVVITPVVAAEGSDDVMHVSEFVSVEIKEEFNDSVEFEALHPGIVKECDVFITKAKKFNGPPQNPLKPPPTCPICHKTFSNRNNLKTHIRVHRSSGKKYNNHQENLTSSPFECDVCKKKCSRHYDLLKHKKIHTVERPHICHLCQKNFKDIRSLKYHIKVHTGIQEFQCDFCDKRFYGSSGLIRHRRTHTGERPYSCLLCNKRFTQSTSLARHQKVHRDKTKGLH